MSQLYTVLGVTVTIWLGIFIYLLRLGKQVKELEKR
ncbi:MAG: CcmD family protein [Firmicutes bacterium]|nr:CcmD family protein [Bacillota bacterium]